MLQYHGLFLFFLLVLFLRHCIIGFDFEQTEVDEDEPVQMIRDNIYRLEDKKNDCLPGFKVASSPDYTIER